MNLKFRSWQAIVIIWGVALLADGIYAQGSPNVSLLANVNDYPAIGYSDCWGYTAPNGREYALLGVLNGTSIIDITNNGNVVEVAFVPIAYSEWKDIKTYQNFAYVVSDVAGNGMQVIDLSDLPNSASLVNTYNNGFQTSHNIAVDEANAMLYVEATEEGNPDSPHVRALSLADPINPVQVSTFGIECHDIFARNNMVYVSEGGQGSIGIFDLSNPSSPVFVARISLPNAGFSHNAWLNDDGNFLITTEETTGKTVKLWDIQNLSNPSIADEYLGPNQISHNAYIKGNFAYVAHYTDGLRILDISFPENIVEAGYYDTFPGGSIGEFEGAWGAFPFFPSGKIILSDIQSGLFVFSFDQNSSNDMSLDLTPNNPPIVIPTTGGSFSFGISLTNNTGSAQSFDVWNTIIKPNGAKVGPTVGPVTLEIPAGATRGKPSITQNIPAGAPAGIYTYIFNIGDYPNRTVAADRFTFSKSAASVARISADFTISNWDAEWDVEDEHSSLTGTIPEEFSLEQNYPNPFNPSTTIAYKLPRAEKVNIVIYDLLGQQVKELVDQNQPPGSYSVQWDGRDQAGHFVSTGLYIYQIKAGEFNQTRKMVFVK